jgi:arabinogalactan endo-1,4-beta-galactosidase
VELWFANAVASGVRDFDYIGVSYCRKWSTLDMPYAEKTLLRVNKRFNRPIVVVEVSYPFPLKDAGDKAPNLLGADSLHRGYPATLRGQQRFMNDVVQMRLRVGRVGVVYWEPAWVYEVLDAMGYRIALGKRDAVRFPEGKRTHARG